jgi:hypothetical protein
MRFKREKKTSKQIGIKIIMIKLDKKIKLHQIIMNEIKEKKKHKILYELLQKVSM